MQDLNQPLVGTEEKGYGSTEHITIDLKDEAQRITRAQSQPSQNSPHRPSLARRLTSTLLLGTDVETPGSSDIRHSAGTPLNSGGATLVRQNSTRVPGLTSYVPSGIVDNVPFFQRQVSTNLETYYCNICFANQPLSEGLTLSNCGHQFCVECIRGYWQSRISDGQIFLKCFHPLDGDKTCGVEINEFDIKQTVSADTIEKFERYKTQIETPDSRECPYCNHSQVGTPDTPVMTCTECSKLYCYFHSNAHPIDETCESYDARMLKETKLNEDAIDEAEAKPCPGCRFRVVKISGCNHMKCAKCKCSWCWLCGEKIDDSPIPEHFKDVNSSCKGKQFEGMEGGDIGDIPMPAIIVAACCICIFGIPALALAVVLGVLWFPMAYCCGWCVPEESTRDRPRLIDVIGGCWFFWIVVFLFFVLFLPICILGVIYRVISTVLPCLPRLRMGEPQPNAPQL